MVLELWREMVAVWRQFVVSWRRLAADLIPPSNYHFLGAMPAKTKKTINGIPENHGNRDGDGKAIA
jgi:hypothetical protein